MFFHLNAEGGKAGLAEGFGAGGLRTGAYHQGAGPFIENDLHRIRRFVKPKETSLPFTVTAEA